MVELGGKPLLSWSLEAFAAAPGIAAAVIAVPPGHEDEIVALVPAGLDSQVVVGGGTRAESVGRALEAVPTEVVAVHDAARPLVSVGLIEALLARLARAPDASGVIAAAPVTDTIKRAADGETITATEDRSQLWAAQTPQVFRTEALRSAHAHADATAATDDAMLVERTGGTVLIEPSPHPNLKVTTHADLRLAELLLG